MIQANELRIGNLVKSNNPKARPKDLGKICYIQSIDSEKQFMEMKGTATVCLMEDEFKDTFGQFLSFFEPIPLTEEWLLRFGFPLKAKYRIEDSFDNYEDMSFDLESMSLYADSGMHALCNRINWTKLKYVHQLQNLYFALTGEELKLNEK